MMFVELFAPKGVLGAEERRRLVMRLGALEGLVPEEQRHAGVGPVFGSMFHVVVHEPEHWVRAGRLVEPETNPVFVVRIHVPGPWRKDMSEYLVQHVTGVLTKFADETGTARQASVQVHVLGVPEGGLGVDGQVRTSTRLVDMMGEPYEEDLAAGRALRDPLCGVIIPLNDHAVTLELDGTLYGFCCAGCRDEFVAERQRATPA